MRIRFYVNRDKPGAKEACRRLEMRAVALGMKVCRRCGQADVMISLGGDGTMLRAIHEFPLMPILGFNLGGLGYLASVGKRDFVKALRMLAAGRFGISERCLLEVNGKYRALNDIVITREMSGHSIRLDLQADGRLVAHYMADGLIFATPTGSTAYSLAAGGPVVMPDSGSLVVTPMNPHALGIRPLVVKDSVCFRVTAQPRTSGNRLKLGVYADGECALTLDEGQSVCIARSERKARIVELAGYDPYEVLARKLGWSGSNVR